MQKLHLLESWIKITIGLTGFWTTALPPIRQTHQIQLTSRGPRIWCRSPAPRRQGVQKLALEAGGAEGDRSSETPPTSPRAALHSREATKRKRSNPAPRRSSLAPRPQGHLSEPRFLTRHPRRARAPPPFCTI